MRAIPAEDRVGVLRGVDRRLGVRRRTRLVRGLVLGIVGAFAAGGVVIALARVYVDDLGAGDPGYGVLFGAVFAGLGAGMWRGPRVLRGVTRRRLFGLALVAAGVVLVGISLVGDMVLAALLSVLLGFCAGVAWVTGYTILGLEVEDALRGRTFGFVQSLVRLVLALVLAAAPLLAGLVGPHRWRLNDDVALTYGGTQLDVPGRGAARGGRRGGILPADERPTGSVRGRRAPPGVGLRAGAYAPRGVFVALEGGEGVGKSTQARLLGEWLAEQGYEVVLTHEPGDTEVGAALRRIVLDPATGELSPRTEALLYAADKAEHVARVVRPALDRGAVVVTDRYVDSTARLPGRGPRPRRRRGRAGGALGDRLTCVRTSPCCSICPAAARALARRRARPDRAGAGGVPRAGAGVVPGAGAVRPRPLPGGRGRRHARRGGGARPRPGRTPALPGPPRHPTP